jgi:hypothetical protein
VRIDLEAISSKLWVKSLPLLHILSWLLFFFLFFYFLILWRLSSGSRVVPRRRTDREASRLDEADSHFSQYN